MSFPTAVGKYVRTPDYAFEHVTYPYRRLTMAWEGSVDRLLDELPGELASLRERFWHPSLIMQAVVRSASEGPERTALINEATSYALEAYSGAHKDDSQRRANIAKRLTDFDLLDKTVRHEYDEPALVAADPDLTCYAASCLAEDLRGNRQPLFMPLSPHGLLPGMQMALFYEKLRNGTRRSRSVMYPVRFDIGVGDQEPQIVEDEIAYLRSLAVGRTPVILAGDATDERLDIAQAYFADQLDVPKVTTLVTLPKWN